MTQSDWDRLMFFNPQENWGDPNKMQFHFVWTLDCMRRWLQRPIHIVQGTQGEHVKDSRHFHGDAADIVIEPIEGKLNVLLEVLRFPFTGVGFFPQAKGPFATNVAFHLDQRKQNHKSLWLAQSRPFRQHVLSKKTLERFGVI